MLDDVRPIMPSLIRLIAGAIVLFVVQSIVLGLPGITGNLPNTTIPVNAFVGFTLGSVGAIVVLKFGTQLSNSIADTYRNYKAYVPLLTYFFQMAALWILYNASQAIASDFITSAPWAYPLIFLGLAIMPTVKAVVNIVHALEGHREEKHILSRLN